MNLLRIATFKLEEVIPFVFTSAKRYELILAGHKYTDFEWINASKKKYYINKKQRIVVTMGSHRYQLFAIKGTDCVKCGIKGKFLALEYGASNNKLKPHFNLYGIDERGNERMITKDHIIPRSRGGANTVSNYQPLCEYCNKRKASNVESKN